MVAEVIIISQAKDLNRVFDYQIPAEFVGIIRVGSKVLVPFGSYKTLSDAFVINIKEDSKYKLKEIVKVEEKFSISEQYIELAKNMSKEYFCNISDCIKLMLPPGTLTKELGHRVKEKSRDFVYLKQDIEETEQAIQEKKVKSDKQIRILKFLMENDGVLLTDLECFTDTSRSIMKTLEKNGYIEIIQKEVERNPIANKNIKQSSKIELNIEQKNAYQTIKQSIDNDKFEQYLIYGVTGSGKTEIYLQLIEDVIKKNRTAIMLVPEISLTPQMIQRFVARFGEEKLAVLHSKLSLGERYDQWMRIKKKEASIVIGARSAIFAPIEDLGIVILDEEHDSSYKSDTAPRYHVKDIAKQLATINNIPFVLGSATPDIITFHEAQTGKIKLLELTKRANQSSLPKVEIVDLREEIIQGNKSMISRSLYQEIEENIKNKKQTILFLNRRGFSTFVMCRDCGHTVKCKNCNITLTYHLKENRLKCHYCGYEQDNVTICPECNSPKIKYFGTGTQKLEAEIQKLFPNATTIRMDIDTVTKKNSHEEILTKFQKEGIDILIGTQMVVKGHHFPNVTLVGVIAADSSLYMEDYRSNERTFSILTQVAGRAGRENNQGKVVIQTYNPDNFSIECAKEQNYSKFYQTEITIRNQLKFPPFCDIILIGLVGEDIEEIKKVGNRIYNEIKEKNGDISIYPVMPAPIDRIKNKYRWRIIIKGNKKNKLIEDISETIRQINQNKTRIIVDVNPSSMM